MPNRPQIQTFSFYPLPRNFTSTLTLSAPAEATLVTHTPAPTTLTSSHPPTFTLLHLTTFPSTPDRSPTRRRIICDSWEGVTGLSWSREQMRLRSARSLIKPRRRVLRRDALSSQWIPVKLFPNHVTNRCIEYRDCNGSLTVTGHWSVVIGRGHGTRRPAKLAIGTGYK